MQYSLYCIGNNIDSLFSPYDMAYMVPAVSFEFIFSKWLEISVKVKEDQIYSKFNN